MSLSTEEKESISKKLFNFNYPNTYDLNRKNNTGFLPELEHMSSMAEPPRLGDFLTEESWLIFNLLEQSKTECKWMLYPCENWPLDPYYSIFQKFVKQVAVVNDASERAIKLIQETVTQTIDEKKLQKILLVKSKLSKPTHRTKKNYRDAANQLSPSEQLDLVFGMSGEEQEISSCSEMDSSIDIVDEEEVLLALDNENNLFE